MEDKKIVVSGGFSPLHFGHLLMIKEAAKLKGKNGMLIVILNNDNWLKQKRKQQNILDNNGNPFIWQNQYHRKSILESIKGVDLVIFSSHTENCYDISICDSLLNIQPDIFANGGDRKEGNIPEYNLCEELGIEMKFNVGGGDKAYNSSDFIKYILKNKNE